MTGDLDILEADWVAREIVSRAGAVVVSVDYRLAVGGVTYPVPLDDVVAAVRWVRDQTTALGIDPAATVLGGGSDPRLNDACGDTRRGPLGCTTMPREHSQR